MKLFYLSAFFLLAPFFCFAQASTGTIASPGLSPMTKQYLATVKAANGDVNRMPGYVYRTDAAGRQYLSALIKISDAAVADSALHSLGVKTGTKAGDIWTVQVPIAAAVAFTTLPGIAYIQLDEPVVMPHLDVARKDTRVDSVQGGYHLPMAYSGKNVVVGVIDFGFDYNHPAYYDTTGTAYRIKRVWEMNGSGPAPAAYGFGRELTDTNAIKAEGTDNASQIHGTSTSSIAAGSGFGSGAGNNIKYRGMAYGADVVLVGVRRDSIGGQWMNGSFTDFIDGLGYIFNYAASVSKPAVVNISWGSQSGPHDGTTLFNQACNNLSGAGKIIVMSAGNEGQEHIHLAKTFTAADSTVNTFLNFTPANYKRTWIDVWGEPGKTFCAKATLYHGNLAAGNTTGFVCLDNNIHNQYLLAANGTDTCYVTFINALADYNGKSHMLLNIWNKSSDSIGLSFKATSGSVNMWDEYYYYGYTYGYQSAFDSLGQTNAVRGDTMMTASDMGSAQNVLLVGAYSSRPTWKSINQTSYYIPGAATNAIAPFSSRGPLADGRIEPDITAPGLMVITATNSKDTSYSATGTNVSSVVSSYQDAGGKTYYYAAFDGTSASSPVAAGIVALLLQANPSLTPAQVKNYIFQSAIQDTYTGVLPAAGNNTWGHGKINAYGAMKLVLQNTGVYTFQGQKLDCVLFPNPNEGSFTLDYTGARDEDLSLQIMNITGAVAASSDWHVAAGHNQRQLQLTQLPKGMYIVRVSGSEGSVSIRTVLK